MLLWTRSWVIWRECGEASWKGEAELGKLAFEIWYAPFCMLRVKVNTLSPARATSSLRKAADIVLLA